MKFLSFVSIILIFLSSEKIIALDNENNISGRYFTDETGNLLIKVNVWGQVKNPGVHLINEGSDFTTLISTVGGPIDGADLKKIKLYRANLEDENIVYNINFNKFLLDGDRDYLIKLKPHDTVIIPQKFSNRIIQKIDTLSTVFTVLILYLQIQVLNNQ